MLWRCSRGHEWEARFHSIRFDNTWCPKCFTNEKRGKSTLVGIDRARATASKLGFEIIGEEYRNSYAPLMIRHLDCSTTVETTYHRLTHGLACPTCNLRPPANEDDARTWARRLGGDLLGFAAKSRYNSTWRCAEGHEWRAAWSSVKKGSWCPICRGKKSNSDLHKQAKAKLYQHRRYDSKKGFETTLTLDELIHALQAECVYCSRPASNVDRKDSNIGHTTQNCVPCCKRCNIIKNSVLTYEVMLKVGEVLKRHDP